MNKYIVHLAVIFLLAGCAAAGTSGSGSQVQMYGQISVGAQHTFK